MMVNKRISLTEGNVNQTLRALTVPMVFGLLGIVSFNLADTYFVGQLGTNQMAALAFTFPVVLILNSLNLGLGVGASAVISKAVGEKEREKVIRLSTDSLSLGLTFAILAMLLGQLTIQPLFTLLGADQVTMPHIINYMRIWYAGVPLVVIPMVGNSVIRALGDPKTPGIVMIISAVINIILDPLLIFGIGIFPELNVSGAALATVFARGITFCVALYVLIIREKVISLKQIELKQVLISWKIILYIGIPNAIARMAVPLGSGIITGLIATYGTSAVAGYGVATKVEFFSIIIISALASVIPVFVGQNYGAKKIDRIKKGVLISEKFSISSGLVIYVILFILSRPISYLFTDEQIVSDVIVMYLRVVPLGYTFQGILMINTSALNAMSQPVKAAILNLVQILSVYVPLAILISKYFGIIGIFVSLPISYFIIGWIAHCIVRKDIEKLNIDDK